jgi:hypothetical protein
VLMSAIWGRVVYQAGRLRLPSVSFSSLRGYRYVAVC